MTAHRFLFVPPSPRELEHLNRWKWVRTVSAFPLPLIAFLGTRPEVPSALVWSLVWMVAASLLMRWRLDDIARRDEQAHRGFIEITPDELHIRLSVDKMLCSNWSEFQGFEVYRGWVHIQFSHTRFVRLRDVDNPDALLHALRAQTSSRR